MVIRSYLADKSLDELHAIIEKGRQAKVLMLENVFFKDVLIPALEEEITSIDASLVWAPGSNMDVTEKIAIDRVWKSGILFGMAKLWQKLNHFKNEGSLAEKELGLRKN